MSRILLLSLLALLSACSSFNDRDRPSADARLRSLYESEWHWRQDQNAQQQGRDGSWEAADHWPRVDAQTQQQRLVYWEEVLEQLAAIPRSELSAREQVNAAVFEQIVRTAAGFSAISRF